VLKHFLRHFIQGAKTLILDETVFTQFWLTSGSFFTYPIEKWGCGKGKNCEFAE